MLSGMEMMSCPNLAVPAAVMRHIVDVESGYNPFAIGVVGARLERQPQNLGEALATARMLEAQGYNFSVGLGQVNRFNLGKYGLDTYEKAFSACPNLSAASRILSECYVSSGGDWGKSFSCYYAGDFITGYRDGYVQKVYASIGQSEQAPGYDIATNAIPVEPVDTRIPSQTGMKGTATVGEDSPSYRVAIRSVLLDTAATMPVKSAAGGIGEQAAGVSPSQVSPLPQLQRAAALAADALASAVPSPVAASDPENDIFVPLVRGPHDPPQASATGSARPSVTALPPQAAAAGDHADLRQGSGDDAFVF